MIDFDPLQAAIVGTQSFLQLAALVAARIVPIVQLVPFLGGASVPQPVKMGLTFTLTILLMPILVSSVEVAPTGYLFAVCLVKEVAIGLTLGFVGALVFESVRIAGQLIDQMRGQTMSTVMVPQLKQRTAVTANFMYQFATVLFLVVGGHLLFLRAILESYKTLGPYAFPEMESFPMLLDWLARLVGDAILLGVMLALPVIVSILLLDLLLGLLNKAAPQINVFFLGMPMKSMLGIAVLCLGTSVFAEQLTEAFVYNLELFSDVMTRTTK